MTRKPTRVAGPTRAEVAVGAIILPLLLGGMAIYQLVVQQTVSNVIIGAIVVYGCALLGRVVDFSVFRR